MNVCGVGGVGGHVSVCVWCGFVNFYLFIFFHIKL